MFYLTCTSPNGNTYYVEDYYEKYGSLYLTSHKCDAKCFEYYEFALSAKMEILLFAHERYVVEIIDENHDCPNYERVPIVSIAEQDGKKGVRFCIGEVDIFIEAHNLDNGKEYEWSDAMKRLKEVGKATFSHKQGILMAAYRDEINAALREIGGDELNGYFWSSTESIPKFAWVVIFSSDTVGTGATIKYRSLAVRACAAFSMAKRY